jgi:hypothetical protein
MEEGEGGSGIGAIGSRPVLCMECSDRAAGRLLLIQRREQTGQARVDDRCFAQAAPRQAGEKVAHGVILCR